MWSLLRRLFAGPPVPPDPYAETIRFDEAGFTRALGPDGAGGRRQSWPWNDICEFGLRFTPALFPDPWYGDYMESLWYIRVRDAGTLMAVEFSLEHLDPDALPAALLRHMPDRDPRALRAGLAAIAQGPRHFAGEGEWIIWKREPHCA